MKFTDAICLAAFLASVTAAPLQLQASRRQSGSFNGLSFAQIDALTPQFGHAANVNPTGTGDCDGAVNDASGQPIKVPCACPPDRTTFINSLIGNLNAGHVVNNPSVGISFPSDNSIPSIQARFNAASVTLQNLNGSGKGCPQASTTWTAQLKAILSGASSSSAVAASTTAAPAAPAAPASSSPAAAPASTSSAVSSSSSSSGTPASGADGLTFAQIDALTPQFGHAANVNPTGTGDCDGAVNDASGQPIKVPCACPPDRTTFINSLIGNLNAGRVVNNPSVGISFPTDNSIPSIQARFNAASVTLQNLNGSGKGCPQASTTWTAQLKAILSGASSSSAVAASTTAAPAAPVAPASSSPAAAPASTSSAASSSSSVTPASGADGLTFAQIDALTPQFGHAANVNPTGTGDCDGAVNGASGQPIKVPCACPPDRTFFINSLIGNLNAGHVVNNPSVGISFPTDNSTPSIRARFNAASVTLQNLNGSGKGCPQASTTWTAQLNAILSGQASSTSQALIVSTPAAATPASPTSSAAAAASPSVTGAAGLSITQIDALAPQLGFTAGVNPTGTGDCDGAVTGSNGQPIKVPCSCPPSRSVFIQSLAQDVAAGHAVHNPSVAVQFPTDNSKQSQIERIQASLVALQNLNGEGQGCPAASTTLSAQLKALTG